ncbi:hypothetical protein Moror_17399 [Moniliophthora roreri MCA 2997]|uniref:Uncharacterized protein n=2 Tax=Moniliophthora roreri TaxID=221103 RepID=V2XVB4_MONRO|nr:hypothetical protein Moror_17399 [Moniliophthora roreri MCA 2997]KAI3600391.1 hypothetical protein WG66_001825 [Moniliophthora roreri]
MANFSKSAAVPMQTGSHVERSPSRTPPSSRLSSGDNYTNSSPRAMHSTSVLGYGLSYSHTHYPRESLNESPQNFVSRYESQGHYSPQYNIPSQSDLNWPASVSPSAGSGYAHEVRAESTVTQPQTVPEGYHPVPSTYQNPGWSQSSHTTTVAESPTMGSTVYDSNYIAGPANSPYIYGSSYAINQYTNTASRQISPAGSQELALSSYHSSPAHLSTPTTPENNQEASALVPSPSDHHDSPSLLFAQPQPSQPQPQRLYSHREQLDFFKRALTLPFSVTPSPFVPQAMYKPHTNSDRRRYVEEVELDPPIEFWATNPTECGISLTDALHSRVRRLQGRDETVFEGRGPSVSIRLEWPGYRQWSRQIPTKDFKSPPGPITKAKLAKNVAKCVQRFISERQNQVLEEDADQSWRVGGPGTPYIKLEDLVLVSMHHVSMGSWQPQLRLCRNSRAPVYR